MRNILILAVFSVTLHGQTPVRNVSGSATQQVLIPSGTNTIAVCEAWSSLTEGPRARTQVAISAVSKANPGVVTSTAHGFNVNSRPLVSISGATGTGWASGATTINGTFTATIIDADTFSIPVNTTGNGTLAGTVIFTTTGPRTSVAEWSVMRIAYDGSGNTIWTGWLNGINTKSQKCSDAQSTTLNQQ